MSTSDFRMIKYSNNSNIENNTISGTKEYDKFVLNHLKGKYNDIACFIIPKNTSKHNEHDYQLLWEYETSKEVIMKDLKDDIYDIYGNRQIYVQNPKSFDKGNKNYGKDRFGTLYVHKFLDKKIKDCFKTDKRFVVILLNTYMIGPPHANVLIYDKKHKSIERFDPNGYNKTSMGSYQNKVMDKDIKKYFESITKINNYIAPIDFCPTWKEWKTSSIAHQRIQSLEKFKEFKGSCATWTLWYIDLRLLNPNVSRESIIKKSIKDINEGSSSFTSFIIKVYNYYKRVSGASISKKRTKKRSVNLRVKNFVSSIIKSS